MAVKTGSGTSRIRSARGKARNVYSNDGASRGGAGPDNSNMAEQRADEHRPVQDNSSLGRGPRRPVGARSTADNYVDARPLLPARQLFLLQASSIQPRHGACRISLSCHDNVRLRCVMPSLRRICGPVRGGAQGSRPVQLTRVGYSNLLNGAVPYVNHYGPMIPAAAWSPCRFRVFEPGRFLPVQTPGPRFPGTRPLFWDSGDVPAVAQPRASMARNAPPKLPSSRYLIP